LTRIRTRLAAAASGIAAVAAVAAACGSSSTEDPQQVLHETFSNPTHITSGVLDVTADVSAQGQSGGTFKAELSGPFQGDAQDSTAFPQFDLTAKVTGSGGGQSINFDGGITATSDQAFVTYKNQPYAVPKSLFDSLKTAYQQQSQAAQASQSSSSTSTSAIFSQLGIDPSKWLTNLKNDGTTDVNGASTIHIEGQAQVGQILQDLGKIAQATPGASTQGFDPSQLGLLSGLVQNATIDVYSGADDHLLRKLDVSFTIAPPGGAGGITSANINFAITLSDVNQEQTISAPSGAKPLNVLLKQLGLGGLGPLTSLGAVPGLGSTGTGALPGTGGGTAGAGPSQKQLQDLQSCIAAAGSNATKLNDCFQKFQ
jgi:hypothetical protein